MKSDGHVMTKCFWQGELVRLRPLTVDDAEAMLAEERDSESLRVFEPGIHPPLSLEAMRAWLESAQKPSDDVARFAIEDSAGTMVGTASIHGWQNRNGTFSFAIRIYRAHHRKGYAKAAMMILLRFGFYELRCQKANSETITFNEASIQLHRSLGFQIEGRRRRNAYTAGQYWDEVLFGLTREEFEELEQRTA